MDLYLSAASQETVIKSPSKTEEGALGFFGKSFAGGGTGEFNVETINDFEN